MDVFSADARALMLFWWWARSISPFWKCIYSMYATFGPCGQFSNNWYHWNPCTKPIWAHPMTQISAILEFWPFWILSKVKVNLTKLNTRHLQTKPYKMYPCFCRTWRHSPATGNQIWWQSRQIGSDLLSQQRFDVTKVGHMPADSL